MLTFFAGKYAYIETSSPRIQGDNAKLVKGGLSFSTKKCLSFYYHMYGNAMGTLNVYVGQKKIFTKSGDQGNQWKQATVHITEPGVSQVRNIIDQQSACVSLVLFLLHNREFSILTK